MATLSAVNALPDAFFDGVVGLSKRYHWNPLHPLMVMDSESELEPAVQNPNSGATGLIQFMPFILANFGTSPEEFRTFSAVEQLPYVAQFFAGKTLPTAGSFYLATFLPGLLDHANEPDFVLGIAPGQPGADDLILPGRADLTFGQIYNSNSVFDKARKGYIEVADMQRRTDEVLTRPSWPAIQARIEAAAKRGGMWPLPTERPPVPWKYIVTGTFVGGALYALHHLVTK